MFCANCGEKISEGKAFCRHCGAPVGASVVDEAATRVAVPSSEAATAVQPPLEGDATLTMPPPVEAATLAIGAPASETAPLPLVAEPLKIVPPPSTTGAQPGAPFGPVPLSATQARPAPASFSTPLAPPPPPPPAGYVPGTPPAYPGYGQGQPPRKGKGGLIAGIVVAVVIVLAAAGAAAFLLLRDNGDGGTSTTAQVTTTTAAPTTTSAPTTTTVPEATTTSSEASTTTSVGETTTTDPLVQYLPAMNVVAVQLTEDDARIPVLAKQINSTAPHVPQAVHDELVTMSDKLTVALNALSALPVPPSWAEADGVLKSAAGFMGERIKATYLGIEAMYGTGKTASASAFFKQGQVARDNFRKAFQQFQAVRPGH